MTNTDAPSPPIPPLLEVTAYTTPEIFKRRFPMAEILDTASHPDEGPWLVANLPSTYIPAHLLQEFEERGFVEWLVETPHDGEFWIQIELP